MGWKVFGITVAGIALFIGFLTRSPKNDYKSNGFVDLRFDSVREMFE